MAAHDFFNIKYSSINRFKFISILSPINKLNWNWLLLASLRATSEFCKEQRASDFLQQATFATGNEKILQQITSDFLQWSTSTKTNERILQQVTCNVWISTSNKQRVKSCPSILGSRYFYQKKTACWILQQLEFGDRAFIFR